MSMLHPQQRQNPRAASARCMSEVFEFGLNLPATIATFRAGRGDSKRDATKLLHEVHIKRIHLPQGE